MMGFSLKKLNKKWDFIWWRKGESKVLASDANRLILDEPTNYLDLTAIVALETFINTYEGAIILISHDSHFIKHITNKKSFEIKNHKLLTSSMYFE